MKPSQTKAAPFPEGQSRPRPTTLDDLKKLNPITQAVILGKAIAMHKAKDAKLRSQLAVKYDEDAADESRFELVVGDAECSDLLAWTLGQSAEDGDAFIAPKKPNTPGKV